MIDIENDFQPESFRFDLAFAAVGYERRCRWVTEQFDIGAKHSIGLKFGYLTEGAYEDNLNFFTNRNYDFVEGIGDEAPTLIAEAIRSVNSGTRCLTVFVDISSMSREMIANVVLGIELARSAREIRITSSYAHSKFLGSYKLAPITQASPIKPSLAGWSSRPEDPLGVVFGLGCEPGLALGALQYLEPEKVWLFSPSGIDTAFDNELKRVNTNIDDIFNITPFDYNITSPTLTRGKVEALLNSIDGYFRIVIVPLGPKIFSWLAISTIVFMQRNHIGVWNFSSKGHALPIDREADGNVVWHSFRLTKDDEASH